MMRSSRGFAFVMIFNPQGKQRLRGLVDFAVLFGLLLFFRGVFLSAGPGVDVFVHFWEFYLGFGSVAVS
jgi:hypothetical protein